MATNNSKCTPLTEESPRFFWVDYEQDGSRNKALARYKHSFLKKNHYQAQRNEQKTQHSMSRCQNRPSHYDPLRSDAGVTKQVSDDNNKDPTDSLNKIDGNDGFFSSSMIVLSRPPTIRVIDNLPSSPEGRADKSDIYFHHYRFQTSRSSWPIDFHATSTWFWQMTFDTTLQNASPIAIGNATKDVFLFRSQSIKLLQQILAHTPHTSLESTILIVAHLTCIEVAEANIVAVNAHLHGLKKLVDMAGGLDTLRTKTISPVYCCEVMRGVISCSPPVCHISRPWSQRVLSQCTFLATNDPSMVVPLLGTRFFNATWSCNIGSELASVLQSLQTFISYYEHQMFEGSAWHSAGNDYLIILILRLYKPVAECSHFAFQESLRLSTIVYCMIRFWNTRGLPCLAVLSNNLRQSLDYSYRELHLTAPDLLFWILFTGALASQALHISHAWFVERLAELADELYLVDWHNAAHLLRGYFFPRPHDTQGKCLWESVIQHKK